MMSFRWGSTINPPSWGLFLIVPYSLVLLKAMKTSRLLKALFFDRDATGEAPQPSSTRCRVALPADVEGGEHERRSDRPRQVFSGDHQGQGSVTIGLTCLKAAPGLVLTGIDYMRLVYKEYQRSAGRLKRHLQKNEQTKTSIVHGPVWCSHAPRNTYI